MVLVTPSTKKKLFMEDGFNVPPLVTPVAVIDPDPVVARDEPVPTSIAAVVLVLPVIPENVAGNVPDVYALVIVVQVGAKRIAVTT